MKMENLPKPPKMYFWRNNCGLLKKEKRRSEAVRKWNIL